ncbi:MAG: hypothetical protein AB7P20_05645 [Rhizobiaceae bacterium]
MRIIAIAAAFAVAQLLAPTVASAATATGVTKLATVDLSAAKKKAKKKKKEKVQYMRSAS